MECHEVASELYSYIDGEAQVVTRMRVSIHLQRCPWCGGGAHFEQTLRARVRECYSVEAPAELADRIRSQLDD